MCHNKKLSELFLLNKQSWKPQSIKDSGPIKAVYKGDSRFGPFCASTSVNWVLDACRDELSLSRGGQLGRITVSMGCATPFSEGLKFPVSCGQVHEQKYSHNSHVKWHYRGSLLRSESSRLAQPDSKAGLEMANLSQITNWEVEKMPLGLKAVPLPGGGDSKLLCDALFCASTENLRYLCCPATAGIFH